MLSIFDGNPVNRRRLLQAGALTLGGLTLPSLLSRSSKAANTPHHVTGKSIIFLFQQGGPSQFETYDPKPDAPDAIRTVTDTIQTRTPGVHFGQHMRKLAQLTDKLTVVRSFQTQNGGHNIQPIVGPHSNDTNIGVHYSRVVGATNRFTGMPTTSVIYPAAVSDDVPGPSARGNLLSTGSYPKSYAPFVPGGKGNLQSDMQLTMSRDRFFNDRRSLLGKLDRIRRQVDSSGELEAMDELQRQAYELLLGGGVSRALDLTQEDSKTLARYDTSNFATNGKWNKVNRGRAGMYDANAGTIGKLLLLAKRLCLAGCGFVTIHASYAGVWDMHADGNNLNMTDGMDAIGYSFDHAVSAFVEDLEASGLSDQIQLVCLGEMGRTPKLNNRGGRDHWGKLSPLLAYGAGTTPGTVVGQSDKHGSEPSTTPYGPSHLIASLLQTVFNVGELRLVPSVPSTVLDLAQADPINAIGY